MVRLLLRKMLRDMRRSAMTYSLCALIVATGFCGYCVMSITSDRLAESRDFFFEATAFGDLFADVQQAPTSVARQLAGIEGIARAEGRLVKTVRIEGLPNDAELQLYSLSQDGLNAPLLLRGLLPEAAGRGIVVGEGFFAAHGLTPGDSLELVFAGRRASLSVLGSAISPETIYMIKNISDLLPDPASFEAGFVDYQTMSRLLSMQGSANSFVMTLEPGYSLDDVKLSVERLLSPYGCYRVYDREGQVSVSMLNAELDQIGRMAQILPFLFLLVAAIILYITLFRLIEQQRTQAGILMAIGISPMQIRLHYTGFGAFIGVAGGFLGGVFGNLLATPLYDYYRTYFNLPDVYTPVSVRYLLMGTAVSGVFCALVAWGSAQTLNRLTPAQALRPPAPGAARRFFLEQLPLFASVFTVPGLMAVRNLARSRQRAVLSLLGIACAYMITATLVSMNSLYDVYIFDILEESQRQDITVHFSAPVARADALRAVRDPLIERAEGIVELPVKLRGSTGEQDCMLQGIEKDAALTILRDRAGNRVTVSQGGIVLPQNLADSLDVGVGGTVELEVSYPRTIVSRVAVTGIVAQYIGSTAYMSHDAVGRVSDYGGVYTSVLLKAPQQVQQNILKKLDGAPAVAGAESRAERIEMFRGMMGSFAGMMAAMTMMGVLVGVAVTYTSSLISFEELKREISIMMALGLSSGQCLDVVSTGQWILSIGAIILGVPLTMLASKLMAVSMSSDLYSIPDFVDAASLLSSAGLILLAVWAGSLVMLRKLKKLSPVDLLRERE